MPPVAPAVRTSWEWLKWRVWWRNTWLLIAGTCELLTQPTPQSDLLIPETKSKLPLLGLGGSVLLQRHVLSVFNREDEYEQDCSEPGRRRRCLPPVSPYRCRCQAALDLLFDDVWQQLVGWMKELVQRHWESCTSSRAGFHHYAYDSLTLY